MKVLLLTSLKFLSKKVESCTLRRSSWWDATIITS